MDADTTPTEIIASALRLPIAQRAEVVNALQDSLIDELLDHGAVGPTAEVDSLWQAEIARRLDDIDRGQIATISADEAERIIRGNARS